MPSLPTPSTTQSRQYQFVRLLGTGGFGEVYLADALSSTGFRKQVAIKILKPEWANHPEIRGRLQDEAAVLGLLRHPNIVSAENFSVLDGQPALIMEYVPGISLLDALRLKDASARLELRVIAELGAAIGAALDAAYWRPVSGTNEPIAVLHRDVKPGNVRLTPHGEVKLLDFGIARSEVLDRSVETAQQQPGSLSYMAPELLRGASASPASDVYSLGVVIMECLTHRRFGWAGASDEEHHTKVQTALARLTGVPQPFVGLMGEVLSHDPERRPLAADVARACRGLARSLDGVDLREWCERHVTVQQAASDPSEQGPLAGRVFVEDTGSERLLVETTIDPRPPAPPTPIVAPEPSPPSPSSRRWVLPGILAVLAMGIGLALVLSAPPTAPEDPIVFQTHTPDAPPPDAPAAAAETPTAPAEAASAAAAPEPPPETRRPKPAARPPTGKPAHGAAPPPPPPETGPPREVRIASVPLGLDITVDGRPTGKKTPARLRLTVGPHQLRFGDGEAISLTIPSSGRDLFTYDQLTSSWRK